MTTLHKLSESCCYSWLWNVCNLNVWKDHKESENHSWFPFWTMGNCSGSLWNNVQRIVTKGLRQHAFKRNEWLCCLLENIKFSTFLENIQFLYLCFLADNHPINNSERYFTCGVIVHRKIEVGIEYFLEKVLNSVEASNLVPVTDNSCTIPGFRLQHKSGISDIFVQNWHRGFFLKNSAKDKVTPVRIELTTLTSLFQKAIDHPTLSFCHA